MSDFFGRLFSSDFMPHGYCYLWKPEILWLHAVSDAAIAVSYYLIPLILLRFVRKRRDLPFNWMFLMFGLLILGCGTTHLMEIWTLWHGTYRLAGVIKAATAAASVATAILLLLLIPRALALPGADQLRAANRDLQDEIARRRLIQAELTKAHDELELRVARRTAELAAANQRLTAEIAERKRADEVLQKQASLLELAHDAILVRNINDDSISYWNSGAQEIYGWSSQEALGKTAHTLLGSVYPAEHPKAKVILDGRWEGELTQMRRDGKQIVVASRWALQRDETDAPSAILQINTDITEKKQALDALGQSEERWRAVFENSGAGIALVDPRGHFQATNLAYEKILGYSTGELHRLSFLDIIHEDDRIEDLRIFNEILAGDRQAWQGEKRYCRNKGGIIWANVHVSLIRGSEDVGRFVVAIIEDITARKQAEEEMRKLASLVENSSDFIALTSPDGDTLFLNAAGRRIAGLAKTDQVRGIKFLDFVAEQDRQRLANDVLPLLSRDSRWEGEVLFRNFRTNAPVQMWQHLFFITDEKTNTRIAMATISRDITERKRSEQDLHSAQAQLSHMARVTTLGEFAASIAHEVNQPLAAVVTNGAACLRWLKAANLEEAGAAVTRMVAEGNRASEVIGRIRSLMRKSSPQNTSIDINRLIDEVLTLTRHEIRRHNVSLRTELSQNLPSIVGDAVQLQQVMLNLILNAIEATAARNTGPRDLLVASHAEAPDEIVVSVRDSGIGIAAQQLEQIFQPFFTTKDSGMGMGLSISRSVIEAHGGRLWVSPNQGAGATFRFSLRAQAAV